ncbi:tRNA (adenosine(37)-N6)-threonylcarbamoyltransferase complex ATPase subunit type 1 TsaE [Campylobacter sp. 2018MI35]|uniref:tRNA (adenosine(37)-N6)-threonylcarbamoyltransferase complex ATPase subunit type 1 TsaE n=1 Tax=Campylobacter sp. 2018MI34 TaxID=2800582 RepID=UPI001907EBE1|nr:tRNA (adenosine(37)-N6)-threonylcarbamoyltransferase complex ATPase subunit type 1 TsaE [Campylobacter sp. 2018MI34]MBK1992071.1 tRNA (adenosine(37)-N6)-threonylcarbamoyltransferase complex ATPase subunit type 1 TsaE [Campylobacter sp. 2018MI34]
MLEIILKQNELNKLFEYLPKEGVILLKGDLASGKTTLVKEYVKYLGVKDLVDSPTFSIMQKYFNNQYTIYHYDIYQKGFKSLLDNALIENFFENALHLVEWGDENLKKCLDRFGKKSLFVEIEPFEDKRKYKIYE